MEEEVPVQDPYWKKVILDTGRAVLTSAAKVLDFINAGREDFWKLLIVNLKPIFIFFFFSMPEIVDRSSHILLRQINRCYYQAAIRTSLCCRANSEVLTLQKLLAWIKKKKVLILFLFCERRRVLNEPDCSNYLSWYIPYFSFCLFTCAVELAYCFSGLDEQIHAVLVFIH